MPLTPKQDRFCREYVIDCNGTQAAIRTGYSKRGADVQAIRLLGNARVKERLAELQGDVAKQCGIDAEYVLSGFKKVYERCIEARPARDKEGNSLGYFLFNQAGANKALEMLGKHLVLFTEKIDLTTTHKQQIEIILSNGPATKQPQKDRFAGVVTEN